MSKDDLSAVAVVNGRAGQIAIWHVAAEPVAQTARLCGAWVTDDRDVQKRVVAARRLFVVGDEPDESVAVILASAAGVIDITATLGAIAQHVENLDGLQHASLTPKGNPRLPITWPSLPPVPDWASPPQAPSGVVDRALIRSTIGWAGWLADMANIWSAVETIRISKPHLTAGSPVPTAIPFVLKTRDD